MCCAVLCLTAAGCSTEQPDDRPPPSTAPPAATRTLDPSGFATEETVCGLLTDDQAARLDLPRTGTPLKRSDAVLECQRQRQDGDRWQVAYTLWLTTDLLGEWHQSGDDYEPRTVEGQPAGVEKSADGSSCTVVVRLGEKKALQVMVPDSRGKDACAIVLPVAGQIVRNLAGEG
jgi:Protein of unknown function (DUF3558)